MTSITTRTIWFSAAEPKTGSRRDRRPPVFGDGRARVDHPAALSNRNQSRHMRLHSTSNWCTFGRYPTSTCDLTCTKGAW
ncbi:hypothetical protein LDDCCGHA_4773 [Methylobacterium oxalidis]|nr:hypothetical protein LDDCCGHA_4773 [Methylobacterium oxalidis]